MYIHYIIQHQRIINTQLKIRFGYLFTIETLKKIVYKNDYLQRFRNKQAIQLML